MPKENTHNRLIGASMFSSAGIAEQYFSDIGIDIVAANELLPDRANLYQAQYRITSYNVCYTKLLRYIFNYMLTALIRCYIEFQARYKQFIDEDRQFLISDFYTQILKRQTPENTFIEEVVTVITSYSIHYTKLYDKKDYKKAIKSLSTTCGWVLMPICFEVK